MICLFVSWKQGKISRSTSITSITSKPNKTSTVQSKTTSTSLHSASTTLCPSNCYLRCFGFFWCATSRSSCHAGSIESIDCAVCPNNPRCDSVTQIMTINIHQSIGEMSVKNIQKSCISKQCMKVNAWNSESASCNIRETHAASKAARMRFSFLPRVTEKLAKVCKLQGQAEHGKETQNHKLDTRSLDVGITRASKRSTLTCCETTTTESSKLLKAFWLHKNKAISFGCLGTNASSGHSLQMTNEHAGKLLAKPTASYVCSKSLKPLQAIQ